MSVFTDTLASIDEDDPALTIPVGATETNTLKCVNLAKAPHILYAGATGSGKSVGLNIGISTIMRRNDPAAIRFTMIDPKRVELSQYRASAFVDEVITDMDVAVEALDRVVAEMDRRYQLFEDAAVKSLDAYNLITDEPLPVHVLVVDELADLMDTHSKVVLPSLIRLGQLARAAGIHMMLATQRPAADTVPKKLLGNIPTRIAYMTQSDVESRLIVGESGAEDLNGNGDLLARLPMIKGLVRAQCPFISDEEVAETVALTAKPPATEADEDEEDEAEADEPTATEPEAGEGVDDSQAIAEVIAHMEAARDTQATADADRAREQLTRMSESLVAMAQIEHERRQAVEDARIRALNAAHEAHDTKPPARARRSASLERFGWMLVALVAGLAAMALNVWIGVAILTTTAMLGVITTRKEDNGRDYQSARPGQSDGRGGHPRRDETESRAAETGIERLP